MTESQQQAAMPPLVRARLAGLRETRRDLALLGSLSSLAVLAWCLPERYWDGLCSGLTRAQPWRWRENGSPAYRYVEALRPRPARLTPAACAHAHRANVYRERLQLLRMYRPFRQPTHVQLAGREHLDAALVAGKGAILWVGPFVFSDLLTKIALHAAGVPVSHLSRYVHGFSATRFGERVLNPIRTAVEREFLAERVVMSRAGSVVALRTLSRRLRDNRVVSVSAIGMAHQLYRIPFLNGSVQMAGGAPALALQTGAALLPVFTGRDGTNGWVAIIEPPLVRRADWQREEAIKRLLLQYGALLEYYVARWPDQFRPAALQFEAD